MLNDMVFESPAPRDERDSHNHAIRLDWNLRDEVVNPESCPRCAWLDTLDN